MNYYERPELSQSDMKLLNQSLLHYLSKSNYPTSSAMNLGKAFHTYLLESDKFTNEFAVKEIDGRTADGKKWIEDNKDKIIIDKKDFDWFTLMKKRVYEHPLSFIFGSGMVEQELFFEYDDLKCKAKTDYINHDLSLIVDLKTIANCQDAEKTVKYRYALQAFWYRQGIFELSGELYDFVFVFCEKDYPHGVKYIKVTEETFNLGMQQAESAIKIYKKYLNNPEMYSGYSIDFIEV